MNLQDFAEPSALQAYGQQTMIASGSFMMCCLDFASTDGDDSLCDYDWYEEFPQDIPLQVLLETFKFLETLKA